MDYVHRAVWGMLYADDACIVSRSSQGLAKMPFCMGEVRGSFARNTTPNSDWYTTESCFVSSGHSARVQTIG